MCKVSDKLKLCTCNTDIGQLENYWIFYRFSPLKDERIIGEWMLPEFISAEDDNFNSNLLAKLLNDGNVFDVDIKPKEKDRLQLTFRLQPDSSGLTYGYSYKNGEWIEEGFDPFEWLWHHTDEKYGEILDAVQQ